MRPSRGLPPLECSRGVSPRKAANSRPLENAPKFWTVARSAEAVTGPTPGNGHQPPRGLVGLGGGFKLPVDRLDCFVERVDLPDKREEGDAHAIGNHDLAVVIDAVVGQPLEGISVLNALRGDDPDFRQMAAQGVQRRRALPDHQLARSMAHQRRLVLDRAHGNEALARTPCRLANRRRVDCVVLVAPDIGLHVRRRDEPHRKAEFQQSAAPSDAPRSRPPSPRRTAEARRKASKACRRLIERAMTTGPSRRPRECGRPSWPDQEPDARDRRGIDDRLAHGRPPFQMALSTTTILARLMPFGSAPSTHQQRAESAAQEVASWTAATPTTDPRDSRHFPTASAKSALPPPIAGVRLPIARRRALLVAYEASFPSADAWLRIAELVRPGMLS